MMNKILNLTALSMAIVTGTLILSINANALECYNDVTCAKKSINLIKTSLKKKICKGEGKAALTAVRQKNYDGAATNALDACIKAQKALGGFEELESAFQK